MVNMSMRCATEATNSASARTSADAHEATIADDTSSSAGVSQSVAPVATDSRLEDTNVFNEYEIGISYSPEPD